MGKSAALDALTTLEGKTLMEIEKAIDILTDCITPTIDSGEAIRYTQAALNLAHTKSVLQRTDIERNELVRE